MVTATIQDLSGIAASITDGLISIDADWRIRYINSRAAQNLNREPEELIGQNLWKVFPALIGTPVESTYRRSMENRESARVELRGVLREAWFDISIFPSSTGITAIWRDNSQRKEFEAEQSRLIAENRRQAAILDAVFEADPSGLAVVVGPELKFAFVNPAYRFLCPHNGTELIGQKYADIWSHTETESYARRILEVVSTGRPFQTLRFERCFPDGTKRSFILQARRIGWDDQPAALLAVWDTTGSILESAGRLESGEIEQLRNTVARLELLTDAAADLLAGADPLTRLDVFFQRNSSQLGLDLYLQYDLAEDGTCLQLGSMAGIPEEFREKLQCLDLTSTVCSTVASTRQAVIVPHVQESEDPRTILIRSMGIRAYASHPLMVQDLLLGTLSFGSRERADFDPETLDMLRFFTDLVAVAMARKRSEAVLAQSEAREHARASEMEVLMNTVPAYVWVSRDPACRQMISNQYGYDFLNMHPGSNVSMSAPPEEFPQHHQVLRQNQPIPADEMPMQVAARTGLPQMDQEFDVVFEDGKTFHLYGNATPLLDADDQPAGAVGVFMDITELKQAETEATRLAAENEIKQRLIGQREQERLQIARDLHDGPVQELLGAIFAMQSLEVDNQDPDLKDRIESVKKILETQVKDLREYAQELRPPTLSKFGLAKALLSHAEQFEEKHPNLRLALDVYQDGVTLPEQVRTALFRVYQEALNNIIRHARAKRVTVRFNRDAQGVRLLIEDDGQGLTLPENWIDLARDGHLGLVGMRERIEAVGGALHVSSQPGRGTRVRVTVPV